jgi:hypothetical protein
MADAKQEGDPPQAWGPHAGYDAGAQGVPSLVRRATTLSCLAPYSSANTSYSACHSAVSRGITAATRLGAPSARRAASAAWDSPVDPPQVKHRRGASRLCNRRATSEGSTR